uniref:Putative structural protein n=1 Tax=Picornavirales N_OV_008 TaxID=2016024 RepID=A0A218NJS5_9VIRU|nr:putative structural protein [Picornavirales N_OV_008]
MTASTANSNYTVGYNKDQNTNKDGTRGKLLTDIQMSAESTPMTSTSVQMALTDTTSHDITTILERPVNLGTFTWNASDPVIPLTLPYADYAANTVNYIKKWDFPQAIFDESSLVVDKLRNYQYFKADMEIEIKLNAQPFLQGALLLVYNPYLEATNTFRNQGTRFLASQTSCPYKIVSLEETNSLKLTCPYANIYDLFDLSNPNNQFGTVYLYVLSRLDGPFAGESVNYTVFARFVNPTYMVPSHSSDTNRDARDIARLTANGFDVTRHAQSDTSPIAASDTGETSTPGPVAKLTNTVTTVADALSGVPVLGSVASSVAWVSRMAGSVASVFGWSKPVTVVPQIKTVMKPNSTLIHSEGHDDSTTLALLQDNGIDGSSFVPENVDEMALKFIFGRPNYFYRMNVTAARFANNQLITAWEVSPFSEAQVQDNTLFLGSFAYASMFGSLWRGTINYDIMVVKTPFHQGRFVVVFLPETNAAEVPFTLGELMNTNYNVVCNLKDRQDEMGRTTYRISVPYISNTPWRETFLASSVSPFTPNTQTLDTKTGSLAIYSLVDLSFPPTVADSIQFLIAHSGGEDYQISRPELQLGPGYNPADITVDEVVPSTSGLKVVASEEIITVPPLASEEITTVPPLVQHNQRHAQSDLGSVYIPEDEDLLVPSHSGCDVTAQTTGEYFVSLRALIKRFGRVFRMQSSPTFTGFRTRCMLENTLGYRTLAGSPDARAEITPWYMVSFLYRFYSGSSMLKLIPTVPWVNTAAYLSYDEIANTHVQQVENHDVGKPVFEQAQSISNSYEIRTPFYRGVRCDVVSSLATTVLGDVRTNVRVLNESGIGTTNAVSNAYEAAGDDFSYFFMVGPPPMCSAAATAQAPTVFPIISP